MSLLRRSLRHLPLACVWVAAAWPVALWLVHQEDPEAAVRMAQIAGTAAARAGVAALAVAAVLLVLFPPAPAWLRLAASRAKGAIASDRGLLLKAVADLRSFESAAKHLEVGRLAAQQGQPAQAVAHLARALELDPDLHGARFQLARLLFDHGRVGDARAQFAAVVEADPGHAFGDALLHLGRAAFLLGDLPAAVDLLRRHQRAHGGSRRSHYWLGEALLAAGDAAGARDAFAFAASPSKQRLTAEENWFRALARVRQWRGGRA